MKKAVINLLEKQYSPGSSSKVYFPSEVQILDDIIEKHLKNWREEEGCTRGEYFFPNWKSSQTVGLLVFPVTNLTEKTQEGWTNLEKGQQNVSIYLHHLVEYKDENLGNKRTWKATLAPCCV